MDKSESENPDPNRILEEILALEKKVDDLLSEGKMDQWTAWESYFSLMYEANLSGFFEVWERLQSKIDKKKFNPFVSLRPEIVLMARDILRQHGINFNLNSNN